MSPSSNQQHTIPAAARKICLAPMMGYTDRHFRYLARMITRTALLYTEMIPTTTFMRSYQTRLLDYHPVEHPIAIQFGGNDPNILATCASIAADRGYDEINFNVCCPSERVTNGGFGACLMYKPDTVARCIEAMAQAVTIPITVKHRIGIGATQDSYADLIRFVTTVAQAGCAAFIVHAPPRKTWLGSLSPRQNRSRPFLDYATVYRLKADRTDLTVILNGGITSLSEAVDHLRWVDGVMIGRAAYKVPYLLADVDRQFGGRVNAPLSRCLIATEMTNYLACEISKGTSQSRILRHMHGLFHGQSMARRWRYLLTTVANNPAAANDPTAASLAIQDFIEPL